MNDARSRDELRALLGPADPEEQRAESRWLEATVRALPARPRPHHRLAIAGLAAAVLLLALALGFVMRSPGDAASGYVELEVAGAQRVVADGRAVQPGRCRFARRLELASKPDGAGCLAAGADRVWWQGPLVLATEQDRSQESKEEKMSQGTLRIGRWTLAVLLGSVTFADPSLEAAPREPRTARTIVAPPAPAAPVGEKPGVSVSGQVLDPDGKPTPGASVCVIPSSYSRTPLQPVAHARTDAGGRFTIAFDPSACADRVQFRADAWRDAKIVAAADGFGPAWIAYRDVKDGETTLRLVADLPIQGRVIDLEGRPIASACVHVASLSAPESGDLSESLKAFGLGEMPWGPKRKVTSISGEALANAAVTTDADGRFAIPGLGRERIATLEISGDAIAFTRLTVATRLMEAISAQRASNLSLPELDRIWGARLEIPVGPTQPIEGTVRDAVTREPLAGVRIESFQFANSNWGEQHYLKTTSGPDGRYRLVGMPKATKKTEVINGTPLPWGNQLAAFPTDEQPYFVREVDVPQAPGLETITCDIELHRGIWIEGSVTDKETGDPVHAWVSYMPFFTNPHAQGLPEFPPNMGGSFSAQDRYLTRDDGTFRIPGLPGRAIVGAECLGKPYREGAGSESISGVDKRGDFPVWGYPIPASTKYPTTMLEIDPPEGAASVTCDLEADPGETVHVSLVDREGKPVAGCTVRNASRVYSRDPIAGAEVDVTALAPTEKRPVMIHHAERNIGQLVRVGCDAEHTLTITLEPCATIKGRLLDHLGEPLTGATIQLDLIPGGDFIPSAATVSTDEQGRFTITAVLPGSDYGLMVIQGAIGFPIIREKLSLKPGETLDLGDVRLKESQ